MREQLQSLDNNLSWQRFNLCALGLGKEARWHFLIVAVAAPQQHAPHHLVFRAVGADVLPWQGVELLEPPQVAIPTRADHQSVSLGPAFPGLPRARLSCRRFHRSLGRGRRHGR